MESKLTNLSVIYLGRRGGGATLLAGFADFVSQNNLSKNVDFYISNSNKSRQFLGNNDLDITRLQIPHSAKEIISKSFATVTSLVYAVNRIKTRSSKVLFLMPSPLDWILNKSISRNKIEKYFIIHDAKAHLGEKWPSQKSLIWRFKSGKKLFTLSEYVKNQIRQVEKNVQIITLFHPVFLLDSNPKKILLDSKLDSKYFLFIGRIRKYKGVDLLLDAIKSFPTEEFVIAGEGEISSELPKNCHAINRWLDDAEIKELMQKAQLIIFPYIEASQSGLLPIALEYEKMVVISNVGGLLEQTDGYEKAFKFESGNLESLIHAISTADKECISSQLNTKDEPNRHKKHSQEEFWRKLLSNMDF